MKYLFLAAALLFTGCTDPAPNQTVTYVCPDQQAPKSISSSQYDVTVVCSDNSIHLISLNTFNSNYGASYTSGTDMLHDPFFWMYMFGPSYHSYPVYVGYRSSPYYRNYVPSSYVRNNITIIHRYGSPSQAYTAHTYTVRSSTVNSSSGSWSHTYSSGRTFSTFRSSSSGYRRR
jgi:hypothetical protein